MCDQFPSVPKKPAFLEFLLDSQNIFVVFSLLLKFYIQKLFASSLLRCSIFTLVLAGTIQCVNLFL